MSAKESWLSAHPEIATKVVKAANKALKLLKDDPEAGRAAMRSFFPNVDKDIFNAAFKNNLAAYPTDTRITTAGIERVFDFMKATEGAKLKLKVDEVYTNKYVDAAR
jgi:ABC-type nitrate/sulfonate/bicarbonate transport system substrate-binding protein